jgi:hypothetical protein
MIQKHFVKIYGKRRVGTNFIYELINQNCINTRCFDNQFGDKHGVPKRNVSAFLNKVNAKHPEVIDYFREVYKHINKNQSLHSIVIIKNPYSWYYSIKNFIERKSTRPPFEFKFHYDRYNMLYTEFKKFWHDPKLYGDHFGKVAIIKYEDLLRKPEKHVRSICSKFEIPVQDKFVVPNHVGMSAKFTPERHKFYLRNDHFDLPKKIIKDINNIIDWDLMKFYGYERIDV